MKALIIVLALASAAQADSWDWNTYQTQQNAENLIRAQRETAEQQARTAKAIEDQTEAINRQRREASYSRAPVASSRVSCQFVELRHDDGSKVYYEAEGQKFGPLFIRECR